MGYFKVKDGEEMPKQFKTARLLNKLKALEAAEKLGVSQPTLRPSVHGRGSENPRP